MCYCFSISLYTKNTFWGWLFDPKNVSHHLPCTWRTQGFEIQNFFPSWEHNGASSNRKGTIRRIRPGINHSILPPNHSALHWRWVLDETWGGVSQSNFSCRESIPQRDSKTRPWQLVGVAQPSLLINAGKSHSSSTSLVSQISGLWFCGRPETPFSAHHPYCLCNEDLCFLRLILEVNFWIMGTASSMPSLNAFVSLVKSLKGLLVWVAINRFYFSMAGRWIL